MALLKASSWQKVDCSMALGLWSCFGLKSRETEAAEEKRLETGLRGGFHLKTRAREREDSSPGAPVFLQEGFPSA